MRQIVLAVAFVTAATTLSAQTVPPALMVKVKERSEPLRLSRIETNVRVHGHVAETLATMTFTNPYDRVLQGDLYFPLPEGATVSGYALDIDGKLIDGVAVEKHKGREVFEKIVRQGIDPGLIEWTKGSNFKTRVFPIPAGGSRTIRVKYVTELVGDPEDPAYHLPLNFSRPVDEFALRIEVLKQELPPRVAQGGPANFEFKRWRESYIAETKLENVTLTEDLLVAVPNVQKQRVVVEQTTSGEFYFAIHDLPAVPESQPLAAPPRHVVLFWDASGSRLGTHERELRVLQRYFAEHWPQGSGTPALEVDLILVRNVASPPQRFTCAGGNFTQLIDRLESIDYDGGTQLGSLAAAEGAPTPDLYLLVSDGLSNFGREQPESLDAPLYAISADVKANHVFLRHLAADTGGRYFNLNRLSDEQVAAGIGKAAYSFLSATSDDRQAVDLYPRMPQPLAGRFTLVGRLNGEEAAVTLQYGYPGRPAQSRTVRVRRADATQGALLQQLWAQNKLSQLVLLPERNRDEILALGKRFGMVTPFTSLIVLDSLDQYVEHEIEPPKSLPKMREEYVRRIDTIEHQRRKQKTDKLQAVLAMWQARLKWYGTEFKYPEGFRYQEKEKKDARRPGVGGRPHPDGGAEEGAEEMDDEMDAPAPAEDAAPAPATPPAEEPEPLAEDPAAPANGERDIAPNAHGGRVANSKKPGGGRPRQPGIAIKEWDPKTPYMKRLKAASGDEAFAVYLSSRAEYGGSPAFYLDCADFFRTKGNPQLAQQVLSNVAELELENAQLLRVLAHRLAQLGDLDLAVLTFDQVLRLRPEEPQSYRDLAIVLARRADATRSFLERARVTAEAARRLQRQIRDDYARAVELLYQTVVGHWDGRFEQIEVIALTELNRILPLAGAAGVTQVNVDSRLLRLLEFDVRIIMTWHADNTDIDLWVIEPSGEKAFYAHNRTTIGGLVSRDFTGGYGPEEYLVRRAMKGHYQIKANYYGSRESRLLGEVTVQVDVFTNYGRDNQQHRAITIRLKEAKDTVDIGQIEF